MRPIRSFFIVFVRYTGRTGTELQKVEMAGVKEASEESLRQSKEELCRVEQEAQYKGLEFDRAANEAQEEKQALEARWECGTL